MNNILFVYLQLIPKKFTRDYNSTGLFIIDVFTCTSYMSTLHRHRNMKNNTIVQ